MWRRLVRDPELCSASGKASDNLSFRIVGAKHFFRAERLLVKLDRTHSASHRQQRSYGYFACLWIVIHEQDFFAGLVLPSVKDEASPPAPGLAETSLWSGRAWR